MALTLMALALLATTAQARPLGPVGDPASLPATTGHSIAVPLRAGAAPAAGVTASGTDVPWAVVAGFVGVVGLGGVAAGMARRPAGRKAAVA